MRRADRDRDAAADDAVGAEHADGEIGDVHRAALATTIAAVATVEFEEHALRVGALGDHVAVAAVVGGHAVVGTEVQPEADGNGFLADRHMQRTRDFTGLVGFERGFLEGADAHHGRIEVGQARGVMAGGRAG